MASWLTQVSQCWLRSFQKMNGRCACVNGTLQVPCERPRRIGLRGPRSNRCRRPALTHPTALPDWQSFPSPPSRCHTPLAPRHVLMPSAVSSAAMARREPCPPAPAIREAGGKVTGEAVGIGGDVSAQGGSALAGPSQAGRAVRIPQPRPSRLRDRKGLLGGLCQTNANQSPLPLPHLPLRPREARATRRKRRRGSACRCHDGGGAPLESGCGLRYAMKRTSAKCACGGTATCSLRRNGSCEFSARLLSQRPISRSSPRPRSFSAAPYDLSMSVTTRPFGTRDPRPSADFHAAHPDLLYRQIPLVQDNKACAAARGQPAKILQPQIVCLTG